MEQLNLHSNLYKYIICQPLGGLNDMLCQIGHCIMYAERFNRKLIIDTRTASDLRDHLDNYFQVIKPNNFIHLRLDNDSIQVIHDQISYSSGVDLILKHNENRLRPLDMNSDSDEKFVLHRAFGGGLESLYALKYLKLLPHVANEILQRKQRLGDYNAVLIRNTDYQTDYENVLLNIRTIDIHSPLYVFTDDYKVQDYAKTLGFSKLIVNENLYKNKEVHHQYLPIMHTSIIIPAISAHQINLEVFSDLFLASLAMHIYPTYIVGHKGDRQFENKRVKSGFVNLAIELNRDRNLLNSILLRQ